jgi:hypothetical protein
MNNLANYKFTNLNQTTFQASKMLVEATTNVMTQITDTIGAQLNSITQQEMPCSKEYIIQEKVPEYQTITFVQKSTAYESESKPLGIGSCEEHSGELLRLMLSVECLNNSSQNNTKNIAELKTILFQHTDNANDEFQEIKETVFDQGGAIAAIQDDVLSLTGIISDPIDEGV